MGFTNCSKNYKMDITMHYFRFPKDKITYLYKYNKLCFI